VDVLVIGIFILGIEDAIGGVLFLDESGIFSAVTDCGDYSYGHFSCNSIRHFVAYQLGRDPHYALSKIARRQDKELQGEATLANAKRLIMESRRHGSSTKEEAREAWEGLPEYDLNDEYQWRRFSAYNKKVTEETGYNLLKSLCRAYFSGNTSVEPTIRHMVMEDGE
jgi:hypothetical protein